MNIKSKSKENNKKINDDDDLVQEKPDEMKNDLDKSREVIRNGELPKFDKRERYLNQIIKAERDWSKYNTARLYKKSNPPITSLYNRRHDDDDEK